MALLSIAGGLSFENGVNFKREKTCFHPKGRRIVYTTHRSYGDGADDVVDRRDVVAHLASMDAKGNSGHDAKSIASVISASGSLVVPSDCRHRLRFRTGTPCASAKIGALIATEVKDAAGHAENFAADCPMRGSGLVIGRSVPSSGLPQFSYIVDLLGASWRHAMPSGGPRVSPIRVVL
jgi:hypothetical protein